MTVSVNLRVRPESKQIEKTLRKLDNNRDVQEAIRKANNDTGYWFRDQVLTGVGKSLGITKPRQRLKGRTRSKSTKSGKQPFRGDIWLKPIPVHDIVPSSRIEPTKARRKRLRKKAGFAYRGTTYQGSWLAKGKNSSKNIIIQRKGKARYPTKSVTFDSTQSVTRGAIQRLRPKLDKRYITQLRRRVRQILRGFNR